MKLKRKRKWILNTTPGRGCCIPIPDKNGKYKAYKIPHGWLYLVKYDEGKVLKRKPTVQEAVDQISMGLFMLGVASK